ncbi:hypothetical protein lbkm_1105 [Lachnospiraceae bacterium KM106-2]|nr:hypothetical protein lbkm_1105 [Lachnospiraceae bacterium KM106-2]
MVNEYRWGINDPREHSIYEMRLEQSKKEIRLLNMIQLQQKQCNYGIIAIQTN